ncbi:MAG: hypothetical protein ACLFQF_03825 [Rhodosalinus sp.]
MLKTIEMGSGVLVQGLLVAHLPGNRIAVRVGDKIFTGPPVEASAVPA